MAAAAACPCDPLQPRAYVAPELRLEGSEARLAAARPASPPAPTHRATALGLTHARPAATGKRARPGLRPLKRRPRRGQRAAVVALELLRAVEREVGAGGSPPQRRRRAW
jgi:hypothetical protein